MMREINLLLDCFAKFPTSYKKRNCIWF